MSLLPPGFRDPSESAVYDSILDLIGSTPLVRLNVLTQDVPAAVYVKLDHFNVGGSSKDRIGLHILREALAAGELDGVTRIVETGQGNTSLGLALAGARAGLASTVIAKPDLSPQKLNLLRMLGVEVIPGRFDVDHDDPEHAGGRDAARGAASGHVVEQAAGGREQSRRPLPVDGTGGVGPDA